MPYIAITDTIEKLLNKESPAFKRFGLGTFLKGLSAAVETHVKSQATHNYGGAHADWTLSASEQKSSTLIVTNADAAVSIIAPASAGYRYTVRNTSGQTVTIKKSGGTGVQIANGKTAIVEYIGSDYVRITADA